MPESALLSLKKRPMGHEKKYKVSVGTYNGQEIENSQTLGEYSSSHPKPRVYLLSKQTPLAILTDGSSDSDFEIPKITINKRNAPATATATEPTAMALNHVSTLREYHPIKIPLIQKRTE